MAILNELLELELDIWNLVWKSNTESHQIYVTFFLVRRMPGNNRIISDKLMGRGSSVGIATRYELDGPCSALGGGEFFRTLPDRSWGLSSPRTVGTRSSPG
jgi:hypothetical protein